MPWRSTLYPENWTPPENASFTSDKLIQDFSYAGYRRGEEPVPNVTGPVFNAVTTYGADPAGVKDSTTAIQNAINAAATAGGGVVFLPMGTYRVAPIGSNAALRIQNPNIVLRGAGVGQTFILNTSFQMRGKAVVRVAPPSTSTGPLVLITADLDKPTRRIPVANPSAFQVGNIIRITWEFTQGWIDEHNQGAWWSEGSAPAPAEYIRHVTAVNTDEGWIEIDVPTRYTMKTRDNASVRRVSGKLSGVGVEGLSVGNVQHPGSGFGEGDYNIEGTAAWDAHGSWLVHMSNTIDSWITHVHSFQPAGNTSTCHMLSNGIALSRCARVTVAHCEMRRGQYGGAGGNAYMFRVQQSHENLIRDSIADFSRHGFVIALAGTSGNVFLRCDDRETQRATGSTGSYTTSGSGSDHHMHFSHSNLWDQCHAHNSFYTASHRTFSGTIPHGLTSAHGVYWNTTGSGTRGGDIVRSDQLHHGYVIGTSGTRFAASSPSTFATINSVSVNTTAPIDHLEGVGQGATMAVPSLYLDQLAKRMQGFVVSAGKNAVTESTSAYPLGGSIYTYDDTPVSSLWTQVSGPATAVFADASSPTTTVALTELGTYVLELTATDGNQSASAQVVIQVALSTPRSAAHFIRGEAQDTSLDPPGYYTSASDVIGTQGTSGRRDDRNVVLGYTLPTLPAGSVIESATLGFEITAARDSTGATNLPELHVYLLDTVNPAGSGTGFFYHGALDNNSNVKRIGTTSVPISGTLDNNFATGEQVRFLTLSGDALALFRGYYDGHLPTRSTVYFRFNLSVDPSMNDIRRYRVNTASSGSSLYLKPNAIPSVNAGPDQTVLFTGSLPWTPALIPTAAWYDAADAATITKDGSNKVSQWNDKSGNNRNATRTGTSNQPTYRASDSSMNNNPTIGVDSLSGSIGLDTPSMSVKNIYAVTYYGTGANANFSGYPTLFSGPGSNGEFRVMGNQNTANFITTNRFNDQTFKDGATSSSDTVLPMAASVFKFKSNASRTQVYSLGYNKRTAGRTWQGFYSEFIFTDGTENLETEQKIEGYLAHKWGLTAKLPADHPYKTLAPSAPSSLSTLSGSSSDPDNDPLTFSWSKVSGPGDVIFANPSAADSTATFSSVGTYVLRLTVGDGFSTNFDEVTITVDAPVVEPKTYDVYFIAGQSNAEGLGYNSDLTGALASYAEPQPGVKIFYVNPTNQDPVNPAYNTGWTTLAPGFGTPVGFGSIPSNRFGFELSLGKALAAHDPSRNVAIIKITRGGTNLHTQWDPHLESTDNFMWRTFANKVPEALAALTAGGDTVNLRGMFWHQGESDGSNPTYQADLVEFIAAVRSLVGRPDLPFAMGELERDGDTLTVKGSNYQQATMANVADADHDAIVVSSAGLVTFDGTHFTSASYITFGERFAAAFHDFEEGLNYSVTYDGNSSTGGTVPVDSRSYNSVASATVLDAGDLAKSGEIFSGWNTAEDGSGTGYPPGSVYVITADTTLHAQWTPKITPTVDPWPTAAPITEGQALSDATLSGGGASVPGIFNYNDPFIIPTAGTYSAGVTFTPDDTGSYLTVAGTVEVTVLTAFETWAGGEEITFTGDANADGVADGFSWLLGAESPSENANALLPAALQNNGALAVNFHYLVPAKRGSSALRLQHSASLAADSWTDVAIPNASGTVNGVEFVITQVPGSDLNQVQATIPPGDAGRVFVRLIGE